MSDLIGTARSFPSPDPHTSNPVAVVQEREAFAIYHQKEQGRPSSSALTCRPPTYQFTFHTLPVYPYLSTIGPPDTRLLVCLSVCLYLAFRGKSQKRTCWGCFPQEGTVVSVVSEVRVDGGESKQNVRLSGLCLWDPARPCRCA